MKSAKATGVRPALAHLRYLLPSAERRKALWVAALASSMGLIEVAGIASVIPFLSLLTTPDSYRSSPFSKMARNVLGIEGLGDLVVAAGLLVFAVLLIRNSLSALATTVSLKYVASSSDLIAQRLLRAYLAQPYAFFLTRSKTDLSTNILAEATVVVNGVLGPAIQLIAQTTVIVLVSLFLVIVDPLLAAGLLFLLGGGYALIYFRIRAELASLGERRIQGNTSRYKWIAEALDSIKETKVYGTESFMHEMFAGPSHDFAITTARIQVLSQVPRYLLELLAFGGLLLIVMYVTVIGAPLASALPLIGVYGLAAYRLMPALHQLFAALSSIRSTSEAIERLAEDLMLQVPQSQAAEKLTPQNEIGLSHVSFTYPNREHPAIANVDLRIHVGEWVGFLGGTGSGKSTLLDITAGLLQPTEGSVHIDAYPLSAETSNRWLRNISYVPQSIYVANAPIRANVALGASTTQVDMEFLQEVAHAAALDDVVRALPHGWDHVVGERGSQLSGGERQRIGIARALYSRRPVLLLDEATNALDEGTESLVLSRIRAAFPRLTVLLVSHRHGAIDQCDRACIVDDGSIAAIGKPDLLSRHDIWKRVFAK